MWERLRTHGNLGRLETAQGRPSQMGLWAQDDGVPSARNPKIGSMHIGGILTTRDRSDA